MEKHCQLPAGVILGAEYITKVCGALPGVTRRLDAFLMPAGRDPRVTVQISPDTEHAEKLLQAARKHPGERKRLGWLPLCSSLGFSPRREERECSARSLISGIKAKLNGAD